MSDKPERPTAWQLNGSRGLTPEGEEIGTLLSGIKREIAESVEPVDSFISFGVSTPEEPSIGERIRDRLNGTRNPFWALNYAVGKAQLKNLFNKEEA